KDLPVTEKTAARAKSLPSPLADSPIRTTETRNTGSNFVFVNGNSQAPATNTTQHVNVVDLPSLADARLRAADRTHDMVVLHAMRLVESKSDSLSVVIKPTAGTELSLELHLNSEGIHAQATVTRGDHQFLSQHWAELQHRLEQRGVKLAPLGGETSFTA